MLIVSWQRAARRNPQGDTSLLGVGGGGSAREREGGCASDGALLPNQTMSKYSIPSSRATWNIYCISHYPFWNLVPHLSEFSCGETNSAQINCDLFGWNKSSPLLIVWHGGRFLHVFSFGDVLTGLKVSRVNAYGFEFRRTSFRFFYFFTVTGRSASASLALSLFSLFLSCWLNLKQLFWISSTSWLHSSPPSPL